MGIATTKPQSTTAGVPDFFQQDSRSAIVQQAKWLADRLGADNVFFSNVVGEPERRIKAWRSGTAQLSKEGRQTWNSLWAAVLHLLSHYNFDMEKLRDLFDEPIDTSVDQPRSPMSPPWSGVSLKEYLEHGGADAIKKVNQWVMSFRFGDPYSSASTTCP